MSDLRGRFCQNPWTYAEIFGGGGVYICCPIWTGDKAVGNIFEDSPEEIWNSYQAVLLREGILNGSFDQCDHHKCPYIIGNSLPTRESIKDDWLGPELVEVIARHQVRLPRGPRVVKLGYDTSCNLWCPSCRSQLITAKKAEQEKLRKIRDEFIIPFLKDARALVLSADGDPFGSNHYRDVMRLTCEKLPRLRLGLHTNAVLLDEKAWNDCGLEGRTDMIQISIDASTAETYSIVRRGGDFDRLLSNLQFLAMKHREKAFERFDFLFVVQTRNFLEMPDFVRLGQLLGANSVQFSLIDHWGRGMTHAQYREQKIWGPEHPRHHEFLAVLEDPIFREPMVQMSALEMLLDHKQPSEVLVTEKGEIRTVAPAPRGRLLRYIQRWRPPWRQSRWDRNRAQSM